MCEQLVARSARPFRLDALRPVVERMERYGLAGFCWGRVVRLRSVVALAERGHLATAG